MFITEVIRFYIRFLVCSLLDIHLNFVKFLYCLFQYYNTNEEILLSLGLLMRKILRKMGVFYDVHFLYNDPSLRGHREV